ncbi:thiolase family protein [Nitrososphaera viennensis]|uniref:Acetoacetyl-CoA thiolase or ketoacyl-CoA thiolase n=2 Tax=Nitrososphaera viennensis TaxID=1034015 RepID=A0A060HD78_9ARCH|nr:thiolase family protein [Nitrososphaera viennensis]AIC14689.1 acetoacetyl-CoA thiolase or ketoacyl-CoA thiolase [Nitrososphaera viennensis EN76]UVS69652.1 thiolase family protein [Nitrososphaera viennensis]
MRKVAISAAATSKFTKATERSIFDIAREPCIEILKSHGSKDVDAVLFSTCATEQYGSTIISEMLGIKPKMSQRVDNLCNSGTNAIATAYSLIASGLCDSALVVGAEKTHSEGNRLVWDVTRGSFNFPVHWASMFARSHMRRFGTTEEQMAQVSVKNHKNAAKNKNALFQKPVTLKEVMESKMIAEPVKLLDCSAPCDGASAVLLLSEQRAKKNENSPVWIKGIGQQTNGASFASMDDLTALQTARRAAHDAYEMANVKPSQVDVAELHDAFTILEIMAYEDLCFAQKGKGGKFAEQQQQEIAINPRGGILGCGHPVGATGVAQVAEITLQLSGKAGKRQVKDCKTGLVHNLAAAGSSATVMVLGT